MNTISANSYKFTFAVKATSWEDVAAIFKNELSISQKRNDSDRKVSGLYLVSCTLTQPKLTKSFYEKISSSAKLSVHADEKSASLYPKILEETRIVEERLRWLLLHVSDAIEDYAKLLGYEEGDIVEVNRLDPLTSQLSFEAILGLLEIDQSWARDGVSDEKMYALISESADFDSFKNGYLKKTEPKTIWESVSELVLQQPVKWETISPKLKTIKAFRNKCAHFQTVTEDDLSQVKNLRTQVINNLTKKNAFTASDFRAFAELSKQVAETIRVFQETYYKDIVKLTDASFAAQQSLAQLSNGVSPSLVETAKSVTEMVNRMYIPTFSSNLHKGKTAEDDNLIKKDVE